MLIKRKIYFIQSPKFDINAASTFKRIVIFKLDSH